jgi:uncharacterized protein YgfB (UPF0149 family)
MILAPRSCSHVSIMPRPREEVATNIDDAQLGHYLAASALCPSPSEAHGILCGLICGGVADPESTWLSHLAPESDDGDLLLHEGRMALRALARRTFEELEGSELRFTLFVPDDTRPLAERATALYDWVRGFLYAWGTLGLDEADLAQQTLEIIRDFTDVTRMDLDQLDEGEQNEEALTEVTEFIRVAAMLVYQEHVVARAASPKP